MRLRLDKGLHQAGAWWVRIYQAPAWHIGWTSANLGIGSKSVQLDYLLKKFEFSYHYSSTLFAKARKTPTLDDKNMFAFAPVYDNSTNEKVAPNTTNTVLRAYQEDGNFASLPASEKEVTAILETSKFSGIACYQDSTAEEDGILYAGEIYNINTSADLITLSSCESGYGKLDNTEGLLGLNRAFIYAGTPNVVYSLWKVYDKVSAKLMVDFYKGVLEDKSYSASLRKAKLKLLEDGVTASPHYWSPYLLIGR